jgi:hypothetical protein
MWNWQAKYRSYAEGACHWGEHRAGVDLIRGESLEQNNGGIVQQFGRLYVTGGRLERTVGTDGHKAPLLRDRARYDPKALLGREDAESVPRLIGAPHAHLSGELSPS